MKEINIVEGFKRNHPDKDFSNFNEFDLLHCLGSSMDALLYSKLFWPEFVEIDGMILFRHKVEDRDDVERVRRLLIENDGNITLVEAEWNATEVPYLFGVRSGESTDDEDVYLAEILSEMWSACLKLKFPTRCFYTKLELSQNDVPTITFHQTNQR